MNQEWLKMSKEERLQVRLEEEMMTHEMDVQMLIHTIECLVSKLDLIASIVRR